jgi:hypothetical protein
MVDDKEGGNLEKRLGIWGKDKVVGDDGKVHAGDYYCVRCYSDKKENGAEVFWPAFDPDVRSFPYCRPCVDYLKLKMMVDLDL